MKILITYKFLTFNLIGTNWLSAENNEYVVPKLHFITESL